MSKSTSDYVVYEKGNGKFYCRVDSSMGSLWFDVWGKAEHDTLESAIEQLKITKAKYDEAHRFNSLVKVFTLNG